MLWTCRERWRRGTGGKTMAGVTLKKLAELSGLSIRTVNRVLKNQGEVSPEKCELIRKLAAQYRYVPNIAARNFRLRRKNIVGVLTYERLSIESHLQKIAELERQLIAAGYYPVIGCTQARATARILEEWNGTVDFIGSVQHPQDPDGLAPLDNLPYQFIFVDCPADPRHHRIAVNRETGIAAAYECLLEAGCRRIVHCGKPGLREPLVKRCIATLGDRAEFRHIRTERSELEDGFASGAAIIRSGADAVFFDTDRMAVGFYRYAWAHRIRIPDDISVVGFDDDSVAGVLPPPLSTVAHPVEEISRAIMEIVAAPPAAPVTRTLDTRFVRRDSIRRSDGGRLKTPLRTDIL